MRLARVRAGVLLTAGLAFAFSLLGQVALAPAAGASSGPIDVSANCAGQNAEVEEATAAPGFIYQVWIGCGGIGYSRSADGGASYSAAVEMPGSGGAWDPAIAAGPTGIVYVSYMLSSGGYDYPQVSASFDQGASFTQTTALRPPASGNWGDRDFIAVGPSGEIYVTWDYGPDASKVQLLCSPTGSCAYSNGDLNAVVQKSADGGRTFGPITPIGPGYPINGGYSAPVLVDPAGRVDALYWGHQTDPSTYALSPGYEYFTSSSDGGTTWPASPLQLFPSDGSIALPTWWIDGDLAIDAGGTLYATWDTQTSAGDIGYLSYSSDGGTTWTTPVRVTPDTDSAMHDVEVAGGAAGTAYVAWQTSAPSQGYATYLQSLSTTTGLVGTPAMVSAAYGNSSVWPGDTFGLATLPGNQIALSWGSANGTGPTSEIYASVVPAADFSISVTPASGSVVQGSAATPTVGRHRIRRRHRDGEPCRLRPASRRNRDAQPALGHRGRLLRPHPVHHPGHPARNLPDHHHRDRDGQHPHHHLHAHRHRPGHQRDHQRRLRDRQPIRLDGHRPGHRRDHLRPAHRHLRRHPRIDQPDQRRLVDRADLHRADRQQHPVLLVRRDLSRHSQPRLGHRHTEGQHHRQDHHRAGQNLRRQLRLGPGLPRHHARTLLHHHPDQQGRQPLRQSDLY